MPQTLWDDCFAFKHHLIISQDIWLWNNVSIRHQSFCIYSKLPKKMRYDLIRYWKLYDDEGSHMEKTWNIDTECDTVLFATERGETGQSLHRPVYVICKQRTSQVTCRPISAHKTRGSKKRCHEYSSNSVKYHGRWSTFKDFFLYDSSNTCINAIFSYNF